MRTRFEEQLTRLNAELIDMGTLIEHAIVESTQALGARDVVRARTVMALDRDIDQKEREIESQCLKLLLQQQPVARDLRLISAALKMITDMERIGDQAADVAEIVTMLSGGHEGELPQIERRAARFEALYGARVRIIDAAPLPMSSSEMRDMLVARRGADVLDGEVYARIIRLRDYGAKPQLDWLRERAYAYLKPKRIPHVAGCEQEASKLALRWGEDPGDAAEAGILHDITKKLSMDEQLILAEKYGIVFDKFERENIKLTHAITGAALSKELFGVPERIYSAIRWHTTGRADMTLLEKIIYIADYIEPTRDFEGVERLRQLAYEDIDSAMALGLTMRLEELRQSGIEPHGATVSALAWYGKDKV